MVTSKFENDYWYEAVSDWFGIRVSITCLIVIMPILSYIILKKDLLNEAEAGFVLTILLKLCDASQWFWR